MAPRPRKKIKTKPGFHRDFVEPSHEDRIAALGPFPSPWKRPEALFDKVRRNENDEHNKDNSNNNIVLALSDLNREVLYRQPQTKIPQPKDELDWLACVPEPGQGLEAYVCQHTSRSGRLRMPSLSKGRHAIGLLPILGHDDEVNGWRGPCLETLAELTRAFYQRPVHILEAAIVKPIVSSQSASETGKATMEFYHQRTHSHDDNANKSGPKRVLLSSGSVKGRCDQTSKRCQYQVSCLLEQLAKYKDHHHQQQQQSSETGASLFCIMGITLQDLYDGSGKHDLFCAGMAQPMQNVAVFSFCRYHPHLRMSPLTWFDYGYQTRSSLYSYFEPGQRPASLSHAPPTLSLSSVEFLRRCSKLLLHELGHLYALEHCIYHRCLMMGTGHLVEDFAAPLHICSICLRKLQWRLGLSVEQRYEDLKRCLSGVGMSKEAAWVGRELARIQQQQQHGNET